MQKSHTNIIIFDIAFVLYLIWCSFRDADSNLVNLVIIPGTVYAWASVCFSLLFIYFNFHYSLIRFLFFSFVTSIAFYFKFAFGNLDVIHLTLLIFAANKISINHIVRICFKSTLVLTLLIFLLSWVGLLSDMTYTHEVDGISTSDAHSFGFKYYSGFSYRCLLLVITFLYLRRDKCSWIEVFFVTLFSLWVYYVSTTRLQIIVALAFIVFYIFAYKIRIISFKNRIWKYIGVLCYPSAMILYLLIGLASFTLGGMVDAAEDHLAGRIQMSLVAFARFGVTLFGNRVEMVGNSEEELPGQEYFYIDSGYVYWIIAYGIVYTTFIISLYSRVSYIAYVNKDKFVFFWMLLFSLVNMVNNFFTASIFPMALFLFANYSKRKTLLLER